MNRRHFIMSTAVMAGGAAVRGLAQSPNDTVRMGIVGLGGRGGSHVNAWSNMPNVEIVALCDVDESHIGAKLQALESRGKRKATAYTDMRQLLEDKNIDAISIATPNHWHTLQTIWACQAGKDVYVEKPCSHNVFESKQIVAAARKYDRIVQMGSQSRSSPALQEAVQKMQERRIRRNLHGARAVLQVARHHRQDPGVTGAARRRLRYVDSDRRRSASSPRTASTTTGTGSGTPATATSATRASTKWISRAGAWA